MPKYYHERALSGMNMKLGSSATTSKPNTRDKADKKMLRKSLFTFILLSFVGGPASTQTLNQTSRGDSALHDKLTQHNEPIKRHVGSNGKPCLALESYAKAEVINKDIFEHWVKATNSCGQHIELRVCYRKSNDCIVMNVPPWDTKNSVLGIYPKVKDFQYDAKEKF